MRAPRSDVAWSRGRVRARVRYADYIASSQWRARRDRWAEEWRARKGHEPVCLVCDQRWTLRTGDLHHRTYVRLGAELFEDLVPLCRPCHDDLHDLFDQVASWRHLGRTAATVGIIAALRRKRAAAQHARGDRP